MSTTKNNMYIDNLRISLLINSEFSIDNKLKNQLIVF